MLPKLSKSELAIVIATCVVGTGLMFLLLSSAYPTRRLDLRMLGLAGSCLGCLVLAFKVFARRRPRPKYGRMLLRETVLVDARSSMTISFSPRHPIENPVLFLRAYGRSHPQVVVEGIWRNGLSVVSSEHPIENWRSGVTYPGFLNVLQDPVGDEVPSPPLKILVRNLASSPVAVYAHIAEMPQSHKD